MIDISIEFIGYIHDGLERTMRADRLLSLLMLLQKPGKINARDLAEKLEVSWQCLRIATKAVDGTSIVGIDEQTLRGTLPFTPPPTVQLFAGIYEDVGCGGLDDRMVHRARSRPPAYLPPHSRSPNTKIRQGSI